MKKEYVAFVDDLEKFLEPPEQELYIQSLTPGQRKYEIRFVRAKVVTPPEELPEADALFIKSPVGKLYPQTFAIKVLEELGEFAT